MRTILVTGASGQLGRSIVDHLLAAAPAAQIVALARDLATDLDPYMLADSVIGLLLFNSSTALLRRHLAGRTSPPESPGDIARHVMTLLARAFAHQDSP